MGTQALVDEDIKLGRRVAEAIDTARLDASALLWIYSADLDEWRYLVAIPIVKTVGTREGYHRVNSVLERAQLSSELPLRRVSVVAPDAPLIELLRSAIRTGPGISGIRFRNNVINNVVIDDAYIYRMN